MLLQRLTFDRKNRCAARSERLPQRRDPEWRRCCKMPSARQRRVPQAFRSKQRFEWSCGESQQCAHPPAAWLRRIRHAAPSGPAFRFRQYKALLFICWSAHSIAAGVSQSDALPHHIQMALALGALFKHQQNILGIHALIPIGALRFDAGVAVSHSFYKRP